LCAKQNAYWIVWVKLGTQDLTVWSTQNRESTLYKRFQVKVRLRSKRQYLCQPQNRKVHATAI